jgi:cytoskeletal protein CcmA (bactofilin family)
MWKRDQNVAPDASGAPGSPPPYTAAGSSPRALGKDQATIGTSVRIKGELSGGEDLRVDGQVEGKVELGQNMLIIGPNGRITAQILARIVVVEGQVHGNVSATERVEIRDSGSVEGDIVAPRVVIADGALFRGTVDMQRQGKTEPTKTEPAKATAVATAAAEPRTEPAQRVAKTGT